MAPKNQTIANLNQNFAGSSPAAANENLFLLPFFSPKPLGHTALWQKDLFNDCRTPALNIKSTDKILVTILLNEKCKHFSSFEVIKHLRVKSLRIK